MFVLRRALRVRGRVTTKLAHHENYEIQPSLDRTDHCKTLELTRHGGGTPGKPSSLLEHAVRSQWPPIVFRA